MTCLFTLSCSPKWAEDDVMKITNQHPDKVTQTEITNAITDTSTEIVAVTPETRSINTSLTSKRDTNSMNIRNNNLLY